MLLSDFARDLGPIFIRKIDGLTVWAGDNGQVLEKRLDHIRERIFTPEIDTHNKLSFYRVNNDFDFQAVTVGLSRLRQNRQTFNFVWFSQAEIDVQGVQTAQTDGRTRCAHANSLHFDFVVEPNWVEQICRGAISMGRAAIRVSKPVLKDFEESFGCREIQNGACSPICDKTKTWIPAT